MQIIASRNLLKEATLKKFMVEVPNVEEASPTFPQAIQVAVMLLGSSCQTNEKYKEIKSKCNTESPWNKLIMGLLTYTGLQNSYDTMWLGQNLCDALREAYDSSYDISPSCFVYLLDHLLVLVSCFNVCLYATRSSCTEWLVHLNWNVHKENFMLNGAELSSFVDPIYKFLAYTVHELLVNSQETKEWVKKAGLSLPLLTLRLLVLMCLICTNSGNYLKLLNDVLERSDIISVVPASFMEVLFQRGGCTFLNVLAEALRKIKDPLVVIRNPNVRGMVHAKDAIFLNVFNQHPDVVLKKLFPVYRWN